MRKNEFFALNVLFIDNRIHNNSMEMKDDDFIYLRLAYFKVFL